MSPRKRDRSWPPADAVAPLAAPVTDNHTHLPVAADAGGPGSEAPLSAAELVERAAAVGVTRVVTSACEVTTWEESLALARELPGVRVALAVHPNEAVLHAGVRETGPDGLAPRAQEHHAEPLEEVMVRLEETLRANADVVVAVGESGLDFFRTGEKGAIAQREAFRAHIALAKDLDLPLQIHDRDAHAACVEVLEADGAPERTVFHCFSGGAELAAACAERGWYASIAGPITYPANGALREAVAIDDAPTVIRYPKGSVGEDIPALERREDGVDVLVRTGAAHPQTGQRDVLFVAVGTMVRVALEVSQILETHRVHSTVVDPRWVMPVPASVVELTRDHRIVVTIEDGVRSGGVGARIRQEMRAAGVDTALSELGLPAEFIPHASREEILEETGLSAETIAADVLAQLAGDKVPFAREEGQKPRHTH